MEDLFWKNVCCYKRPVIEQFLQKKGASAVESQDMVSKAIEWLFKKIRQDGYQSMLQEDYLRQLFHVAQCRWLDEVRSGHYQAHRNHATQIDWMAQVPAVEPQDWTIPSAQQYVKHIFLSWNPKMGRLLYQKMVLQVPEESLVEDYQYSSLNTLRSTCSKASHNFRNWLIHRPELSPFSDALRHLSGAGLFPWEKGD